ncbi:hypothetical protein [uncultured Aquitalea sp.]|uniref:hypothetical protein n=1 Tax=uncultured Aquitalea sp. TaxID=540272 RepID=UPI0026004A65|nr:hypothetical protein [uncultured Aquitalea sp.]
MGGKSSSSSASSTTNNTSSSYSSTSQDNRISQQSGVAVSASTGTTVNVLDGGAVAGAIDLAKSGRELANKEFSEVVNAGKYLLDKAYAETDATRASVKETLASVGTMYQTARETELSKDAQSTKQILTVAGFAVVGLAALQAMKKG